MPVPNTSVTIHPGVGEAHFTFSDLAMFDYFTSANAILRDGSAPIFDATASVDIQWTGTGERLQVENDAAGFGGSYENAGETARIEWSAENAEGYFFSTVNSSQTTVTHAFTAKVRNGVFHP
jgi:hypothetical protein